MMRRRLSSCFRAQKEKKEFDDLHQREEAYIQVHPVAVADQEVNAEKTLSTSDGFPLENGTPTPQPIGDSEAERLAPVSGPQEPQEKAVPSGSDPTQEQHAPEVDKQENPTQREDPGTDEESEGEGIEPEWTILDPDDLTCASDYPEFVKLRDQDRERGSDYNRKRSSKASSRKFISGSWELLYNMAAAEIEQPMEVEEGEVVVDSTNQQDGEEEHTAEGFRESEEDELEQDTTLEDSGSAKKKKFKPWKSIRNFFKKKRPGKEDGEGLEESLGVKSKSTGELNRPISLEDGPEGDETTSPALLSPSLAKGFSVSEDSVFSPEKPAPTKEEVRTSAEMNMSSAFASELEAKLKRRSGSHDGVNKMVVEPAVAKTPEHKPTPPKPAPRTSEKRKSGGISMDDEKSFTAATHEERKQQEETRIRVTPPVVTEYDIFDLDLISNTSLLENTAARHRISVAPRARRSTTRPGHRPSKRPVTTHEILPKPADTPSELLQPDPAPKRPKSTPLPAIPYTKPSIAPPPVPTTSTPQPTTTAPPPLPTTPIPSKRASAPRIDSHSARSDDNKSSTIPRANAIPKTKRPPPIKLPRPPSLGPMVLPPIKSSQSLRGGLRPTPPRSKSLGETPSGDSLSPEHNGSDTESKIPDLTKSFDETESLFTSEMLTSAQPNTAPNLAHSLAVPHTLSTSPNHKATHKAINPSSEFGLFPSGSPDPVTPDSNKDLITWGSDSEGSEQKEGSLVTSSTRKPETPFMSELSNVLKRTGRSKTLGSRPSSYEARCMPSPSDYSKIIDLAFPEPAKPHILMKTGQVAEETMDNKHEYMKVAKRRSQTLGGMHPRSPRPLSQHDMFLHLTGDLAHSTKKRDSTQLGDNLASPDGDKLNLGVHLKHIESPPKPLPRSQKLYAEVNDEKMDFGVRLKPTGSLSNLVTADLKELSKEKQTDPQIVPIYENAPAKPPKRNRYKTTCDPTPPPRLRKQRSASTGQRPFASQLIMLPPLIKPTDTNKPPPTTHENYPGAQKAAGIETNPELTANRGQIAATAVETPKQRSSSLAGLLDPAQSDGDANTALHVKPCATTKHGVNLFDKSEAMKWKKSPTSPISPISPSSLKSKPVTRTDSKEPKHRFLYTKKDEAKNKEKEADTIKKEAVSPAKEQEPPKEAMSPIVVLSPKEVPTSTSTEEVKSPKEVSSPEAVASPTSPKAPTVEEPPQVSVGSPKEVVSPKEEAASKEVVFPDVASAPKKLAISPKEASSPQEVLSPKEIGSPTKIGSPKEESVAKELFPSEKDQDLKEAPASDDLFPEQEIFLPTESEGEEKVVATETENKESVPSSAEQKPAESEPSGKPSVMAKAKAGPKRGNVKANMQLFEPKSILPAKPVVSDSSSAPRAMKRWSLVGSQRPSFEESSTTPTPTPSPAPAKPEEKSVNSVNQDPEPERQNWKKPVSPPKQRKKPTNATTQEKSDPQNEEEPEAKPMSLKDRLSKFQSGSNAGKAPLPWKPRSSNKREDSNKQNEANQQTVPEKQVIIESDDKSESSAKKQAEDDSQKESPGVDASQGEKSNEKTPSNQSCENSRPDKKDSNNQSMSSNETTPNDDSPAVKKNQDTPDVNDKQTLSSPTPAQTTPTKAPNRASPAPEPSQKKRGFAPKVENCIACQRPVYMTEMAKAEGKTFHKGCQKCSECNRTLMIGNLLLVDGGIYCKLHGTQVKNTLLKLRLEIE